VVEHGLSYRLTTITHMRSKANQETPANAARRTRRIGGLTLGVFLFVLAMAQFESLHRWFHAEACQSNHQCAVTMLSGGQVDNPPSQDGHSVLPPAAELIEVREPASTFVAFDFILPPSCGPPALFL
jgi:hypothetical protein